MIDRRAFLAAAPAAVLAVGPLACRATPTPRRAGRVGVQLYTVRDVMVEDPDRTLAAVAEIGYQEVELAGLYGMSAGEMRAKLDAVGLRAASSHHGIQEIDEQAIEQTLESVLTLGLSQVVVPSLPRDLVTDEGLGRVADVFNRAAEALGRSGVRFGYHNHDWEFEPLDDGSLPMELLLDRTDAETVDWQMDVFWTVHGGADPLVQLDRRRGRVRSMHIKDRSADGRMVDVGDGVIDFPAVVAAGREQGLQHVFVEHDQPGDSIESVRRSFEHIAATFGGLT